MIVTDDIFCSCLDQIIGLRHLLAVLSNKIPVEMLEESLRPVVEHSDRKGCHFFTDDMLSKYLQTAGEGVSSAGRPRLAIR